MKRGLNKYRQKLPNVFIILLSVLLLVSISCTRHEPINPFDPDFALEPVQNFSLSYNQVGQMRLDWTDIYENESGFIIGRRENFIWDNNYRILPANSNQFVDSVPIGRTYQYSIRVFYGSNESEESLSNIIHSQLYAPFGFIGYIVNANEIFLSWLYPYEGIDGFWLERNINNSNWQVLEPSLPATAVNYTDSGIEHGQNYSYRIRASYSTYYSSYTTIATISSLWDDIVRYWKFDEISGTTAYGSVGNSHGTANNERIFSSQQNGIINTCADFTQGDDYVSASHPYYGNPSRFYTFSVWFKTNHSHSTSGYIMTSDTQNSSQGPDNRIIISDGYINVRVMGGTTANVGSLNEYTDNNWHQVVLVKHGVSSAKVFVDGIFKRVVNVGNYDRGQYMLFGKRYNGMYFNGLIDEPAVWNRALTNEEVQMLYNNGLGVQYPF